MSDFARVRILQSNPNAGDVHLEVLTGKVHTGHVLQYVPIHARGIPPQTKTATIQTLIHNGVVVEEVLQGQECIARIDDFGSNTPRAGMATCTAACSGVLAPADEQSEPLCFQHPNDGAV